MKPPENRMVQLITTMNDCIKIRYEASIRKNHGRTHGDNMIYLDINKNRLINMLGSNMACRVTRSDGRCYEGRIREIQYRNGSAAVTFQPAIHQ
jgi:ribosomal protein L35AE/L33A